MAIIWKTSVETITSKKPRNPETNLKNIYAIENFFYSYWGIIFYYKGLEKPNPIVKFSKTLAEVITIKNLKNHKTIRGTWYVREKFLRSVGCYIP